MPVDVDFPFGALLELLTHQSRTVGIVTLSMEPTPEVAAGANVEARYLDVVDELGAQFARTMARTVRSAERRDRDLYEAGWLSVDERVAIADETKLEGPALAAVLGALRAEPGPDLSIRSPETPAEEQTEEEPPVGAYVVVVRRHTERALIFRRRDPVERPNKSRFTAMLSRGRLTKTERTYTFDAGADVIVYRRRVAILNSRSFEELFSNETLQREGAQRAADILQAHVPLVNRAALDAVITADSRFAGRLRALGRRGGLDALDMRAIERATERFNIRERLVRDDGLLFVPTWRFIWLSVLEDSLVESPGTARPYLARVKAAWVRRQVDCVEINSDGSPIGLVGDWGRIDIESAIRELRYASATYFADLPDGRVELELSSSDRGLRLVARSTDDGPDRFSEIRRCD